VFSIVGECILRDKHWQAFGYRKRPRRGKFFNVLVDSHKIEKEKVLVREFWAAAFGRVFYWTLKNSKFIHRVPFIARLMNLCIDGIDEKPLWPTFDFRGPDDAIDFLKQACRDYGACKNNSDFSEIFLKRCVSYLNRELPSTWIFGTAWLFSDSESMLMAIIPALEDTIAKNRESDISIRDSIYYEVAQKVFIQMERL
jgi:hypothetical protein